MPKVAPSSVQNCTAPLNFGHIGALTAQPYILLNVEKGERNVSQTHFGNPPRHPHA